MRMGPEFDDDPVDEYVYDGDYDRYFTLDQLEHAAQHEVDQAAARETDIRADVQRTGDPYVEPPVDSVAAARGDTDAAFEPVTTPLDAVTKHPRELVKFDGGLVIISEVNPVSGMEQGSFLFQQAAAIGWSHAAILRHIVAGALKRAGLPLLPAPVEPVARDPETIARGEEMSGDMLAVWTNTVEEAKLIDGEGEEDSDTDVAVRDLPDSGQLRIDAFDEYVEGFEEWVGEDGEEIVKEERDGEVDEDVRAWAIREGLEPATPVGAPTPAGFDDRALPAMRDAGGMPALDDVGGGGGFGQGIGSQQVQMDDIGDLGWPGEPRAVPEGNADVDLEYHGLAPDIRAARDRQKVYVLCGGDSSERNVSLQGGVTVRPCGTCVCSSSPPC